MIDRFRGYKRIYRSQMPPFSRLLRHAGKRWAYSFSPAHGGPKSFDEKPIIGLILSYNYLFIFVLPYCLWSCKWVSIKICICMCFHYNRGLSYSFCLWQTKWTRDLLKCFHIDWLSAAAITFVERVFFIDWMTPNSKNEKHIPLLINYNEWVFYFISFNHL